MDYRYKGSPPTSLSFSLFSAAPPLLFCHYYSLSAAVTSPTFCYITVPCSIVGNFFFLKFLFPDIWTQWDLHMARESAFALTVQMLKVCKAPLRNTGSS